LVECKFATELVKDTDDYSIFRFKQDDGPEDFVLTKEVFKVYVELPILRNLMQGYPVISIVNAPILDKTLYYNIICNEDDNEILVQINSTLFKNKKLAEVPDNVGKDSIIIRLVGGGVLLINNIGSQNIGTVMALFEFCNMLSNMNIVIDEEDFCVECNKCVYCVRNIKYYLKWFGEAIQKGILEQSNCAIAQGWSDDKRTECKYFTRSIYPNIDEIQATLQDFYS
jgi:hypothetical protein